MNAGTDRKVFKPTFRSIGLAPTRLQRRSDAASKVHTQGPRSSGDTPGSRSSPLGHMLLYFKLLSDMPGAGVHRRVSVAR